MTIHILDRDQAVADAIASVVETEDMVAWVHEDLASLVAFGVVDSGDVIVICDYFPDIADATYAKIIRVLARSAHFVFVTNGRPMPSPIIRAMAGRNPAVLRKPIRPSGLIEILRSFGPGNPPRFHSQMATPHTAARKKLPTRSRQSEPEGASAIHPATNRSSHAC